MPGLRGRSRDGAGNPGLVHAADMIFRQALPRIYKATVQDVRRFAEPPAS